MLQRRKAATPVLVSLVECWIGQFQKVLKKIGTEQDVHAISLRAYAAIHLCQNLERLHVFGDGNGRVCDQVEFRRLFRQFGLKMPLLDNPGKVDGNSRREVYKAAREGQERADKLQTTPDALSMLPLLDDPELKKLEKEFQELWTSTLDEVLPDIAARHIEQKQQMMPPAVDQDIVSDSEQLREFDAELTLDAAQERWANERSEGGA